MTAIVPYTDMERMAASIAKSGLFGFKTAEQALAIMAVAQAEGLHPATAARDYHVINGRPALKADAMLARFQASGGRVEFITYSDDKVEAKFSHPAGGSVTVDWTLARAKQAELGGNGMWKKYPRQMLRARVISEGIRTVYPGATGGMYVPEEVQDFEAAKRPEERGFTVSPRPEPTAPLTVVAEHVQTFLRYATMEPVIESAILDLWEEIKPDHGLAAQVWDALKRHKPEFKIINAAIKSARTRATEHDGAIDAEIVQ